MSEDIGTTFDVATRTLEELMAQLRLLDEISVNSLDGNSRFLDVAKQLINILAEPQQTIERVAREFTSCSALKICLDLRIAEVLNPNTLTSTRELSSTVGASDDVVGRVMRLLVTRSIFKEPKLDTWCHSPCSLELRNSGFRASIRALLEESYASTANLPRHLKEIGYQAPKPGQTSFNMVYMTNLSFYDYCNSVNLEMGANFHRAMATFSGQQLHLLTSMYPFHILNEQNGIVVDVGGGMGHVSMFLAREFERMVFIVQDREAATNLGKELLAQEPQDVRKRIRFWEHDIFAVRPMHLPERQSIEQPVAYFLKHIVHDWNDEYSKELLGSIACVMQPADRVLIYDVVLPSSPDGHRIDNEGARSAAIINLSLFGGRQRSESQYRALADSVIPPLVVIKIWGEDNDNVESMRVLELTLR